MTQAGVESLGESHELPMRQIMRKNLLGVGVLLASLGSLFPYPTAQETKVSSYQGANDHIMVVIRGGTFIMGSPLDEPGRSDDEVPHRVRIPRTYAIATIELTNQQFERFLADSPEFAKRWRADTAARFGDPPRLAVTPQSPQAAVSWYDAAHYCNWLSAQDNIPKSEWVYPENIDSNSDMELPQNYLHRTGYRLPTEAEWEYAARAGTTSAHPFGDEKELLPRYAWYDENSKDVRAHPVAQLFAEPMGPV